LRWAIPCATNYYFSTRLSDLGREFIPPAYTIFSRSAQDSPLPRKHSVVGAEQYVHLVDSFVQYVGSQQERQVSYHSLIRPKPSFGPVLAKSRSLVRLLRMFAPGISPVFVRALFGTAPESTRLLPSGDQSKKPRVGPREWLDTLFFWPRIKGGS